MQVYYARFDVSHGHTLYSTEPLFVYAFAGRHLPTKAQHCTSVTFPTVDFWLSLQVVAQIISMHVPIKDCSKYYKSKLIHLTMSNRSMSVSVFDGIPCFFVGSCIHHFRTD